MDKSEFIELIEKTIGFVEQCTTIKGSEHAYQDLTRLYHAAKFVEFPKYKKYDKEGSL